MMAQNRVTILCLSYNHVNFIAKTLDSFIDQKANFDFKIVINDDSSDDGTLDVIYRYQKKYPKKVKLIKHSENQYSKGKRFFIPRYLLKYVDTEYFAVCEGDDFWADINKLQKQVDFLDKNKDYVIHSGNARVSSYKQVDSNGNLLHDEGMKGSFSINDFISNNRLITATTMFRMDKGAYDEAIKLLDNKEFAFSDWTLYTIWLKTTGKLAFVSKDVLAVYRRHSGGIFSSEDNISNIKNNIKQIKFNIEYLSSNINLTKGVDRIIELSTDICNDKFRIEQRKTENLISSLEQTKNSLQKDNERLLNITHDSDQLYKKLEHELNIVYKKPHIYLYKKIKRLFK